MRKILVVILFILFAKVSLSQNNPSDSYKKIIPPSPNASSIGKFGDVPLNMSTGLPNISVPLFSLKEGSFSLPVSIDYNYSGFRPYDQQGQLGRGWSLKAGGVITRTVRGIADELRYGAEDVDEPNSPKGYLSSVPQLQRYISADGSSSCAEEDCPKCFVDNICDGEPDIFNFSFGEFSGKFFFGEDKMPHIVSAKKFKIDFYVIHAFASAFMYYGSNDNIIGFKITTEDGTIYRFGDPAMTLSEVQGYIIKNVDFSYTRVFSNGAPTNSVTPLAISAWYLREIEDIYGNKITLEYLNDYKTAQGDIRTNRVNTTSYPYNSFSFRTGISNNGGSYHEIGSVETYSSENFLTAITAPNWKLKFDYNNLSSSNLTHTLNTITYIDKSDVLISKYAFEYKDEGFNNLLDKVSRTSSSESKKATHQFEYYIDNFPSVLYDYGLDYWGYYNGVNNQNLVPVAPFNANRNPDFNYTLLGAIKRIVYPTGGNTLFEYEQNEYSYLRESKMQDGINIGRKLHGGIRLKKTTDTSNPNSLPVAKSYTYQDPSNSGLSSGVALVPVNNHLFEFSFPTVPGPSYTVKLFKSDSFYSMALSPIYYFNVTEIQNGELRTDYTFTSHKEFPDNLGRMYSMSANDNQYGPVASYDFARGLPISTRIYKNGQLLSEKMITYIVTDKHRARTYWAQRVYSYDGGIFQFSKGLFAVSAFLQKVNEVNTTYESNSISTNNSYEYDQTYYTLKKQTTKSSKQKTLQTIYKYPFDFSTNVYQSMLAKNMISYPVEQVNFNGDFQINRTIYDYQLFNNKFYALASIKGQTKDNSPVYPMISYNRYLENGSIQEVYEKDISKISYQWGYNKQYPVAKVINASNSSTNIIQNGVGNKTVTLFLGSSAGNYPNPSTTTFTQSISGNIVLQLPSSIPPAASANFSYNLTGPVNKSGSYSCNNGACNTPSEGITFSNMPAGNYILSISGSSSFSSYTFTINVNCSYQASTENVVTENEYSFEDFEENTTANVITTNNAHSGKKYFNGSYTTSFTVPNSRSYLIQWWSYENDTWSFHQQPFIQNITLNGKIDDIRIYPRDAQMTTYTYEPLVGMTSQTDPKGQTTYYEYDDFQRLKLIKDQNGKVLKRYDYHYQNQ